MQQIINTTEEALILLNQIQFKKGCITQSQKFESFCQSRSWPLPDSHFDEVEALQTEIEKLTSHFGIVLDSMGKLKKLI